MYKNGQDFMGIQYDHFGISTREKKLFWMDLNLDFKTGSDLISKTGSEKNNRIQIRNLVD